MFVEQISRKCKFQSYKTLKIFMHYLIKVWGGFSIVFIAIYTAKLAAFMVETGREHTASNIHEIIVSRLFHTDEFFIDCLFFVRDRVEICLVVHLVLLLIQVTKNISNDSIAQHFIDICIMYHHIVMVLIFFVHTRSTIFSWIIRWQDTI